MKKIFTLIVAGAAALSVSAQAVESHKFLDNWSLGIFGGAATPTVNHAYLGSARGMAGLEIYKKISPVISLGVQSEVLFNTTTNKTVVDNWLTFGVVKANVSNLFLGYQGKPRFFELEAFGGVGINKTYNENGANNPFYSENFTFSSGNTFAAKAGLNFLFNLGESKAWTLRLSPAITWDAEGKGEASPAQLDINSSFVELTAGIAYNFKTSNGQHYFTKVRAYDQAEVDGLNAKINDLRNANAAKDQTIGDKDAQIRSLQQQLNDCRNQKPQVKEVVSAKKTLESVITFGQGKSNVETSQLPNVERIGKYLQAHKDAKVVIRGYASPEGSAEINNKLSAARAKAVSDLLQKKYKISADRIDAAGQGVGDLFSEADWNRVSIATIAE